MSSLKKIISMILCVLFMIAVLPADALALRPASFRNEIKLDEKELFKKIAKKHPGKWYNIIQEFIGKVIRYPIVVYYPGCGSDLNNALTSTNADIFIFVDIGVVGVKEFPDRIIQDIIKNNGVIRGLYRKDKEYVLLFKIWGKERIMYYYVNTDASDEENLPSVVKQGFDILIDKAFTEGGYCGDPGKSIELGLKYLNPKGFYLYDYFEPKKNIVGGEHIRIGTRPHKDYYYGYYLCYFGKFIKNNRADLNQNLKSSLSAIDAINKIVVSHRIINLSL